MSLTLLFADSFLLPDLSESVRVLMRVSYGVLLIGTIVMALPSRSRFFLSERWGGYGESSPEVDAIQNPIILPVVLLVWSAAAVALTLGTWSVWAALVNVFLCRYFFVQMRWKGALRGMGAPGFMTYWLGLAVFLLEFTQHYTPEYAQLAVLVIQVDYALIMLSAGAYKMVAGYRRNEGMELGLVNPEWGYWWKFYRRLSPHHLLFRVMNQLAWSTEVVAGLLMLLPPTRFLGGLLMVGSFAFIATQIRLGLLTEMVMAGALSTFHPGSLGAQLASHLDVLPPSTNPAISTPPLVVAIIGAALWGYLLLLPVSHGALFFNFYARRSLAGPMQWLVERYTNFFGIIIWRVFSTDHTNFFINIYVESVTSGRRELISDWSARGPSRFNHVGEAIALTTVFTTLKYYPSNPSLFTERLLRYARTLPCAEDQRLVFEYISIRKQSTGFAYVPVAEFRVAPKSQAISERVLDVDPSVRTPAWVSPVFEGARPGSYVPLRTS